MFAPLRGANIPKTLGSTMYVGAVSANHFS